jgi:hypothetical protein
LRIKEWQSFIIQDDNFLLSAIFSNVKYYCWAQVFIYDKDTHETLKFRKILPFNGWRMPQSLSNASIDSRFYGFFFRIHNWLDADIIKLDIDIEEKHYRPPFTAHLEYYVDRRKTKPIAVNLPFSEQRSMYAYKISAPVRGDMVLGGRHINFDPQKTTGVFGDFKGYFPYTMLSMRCTAQGFDADNRRYAFSIGENQTKDTFKNNENVFWFDNKVTPLPPVQITMSEGEEPQWMIQDLEGMVDLVFTPQEYVNSALNTIVANAEYYTPIGYYNGALIDSTGTSVSVRNLWGTGEKILLRP